jgi:hypothetical protein
VLYNICQHFRVPSPDPDINEQENGGNYNFENHYDDAQNNFFSRSGVEINFSDVNIVTVE